MPDGAKTYEDWRKDPAAEPVLKELLRRAKENPNCSQLADWLNSQGVPVGRYCHNKKWDGKMVRRLIRNSLLMGMPGRGHRCTVKLHETGRRVSQKNPKGAKYRECPHLAHWEPADWKEVNAGLDRRNQRMGRKPVNGEDPLARVPRKRTRFPGQHATCRYCGNDCVWGGNGVSANLMCNGSRRWECWNSIGFSGTTAAGQVADAVAAELVRLDGFDQQLRALVAAATEVGTAGPERERAEVAREEAEVARQKLNLSAGIAQFGPEPMFEAKLAELKSQEVALARRRRALDARIVRPLQLPTAAELRRLFEEKVRGLATDSPEFGDILRQVAPDVHVYLVRLIDGGHLLPRMRVGLCLGGVVPDAAHAPDYAAALSRVVTLDLFEPPQRERIRPEAVRLAAEGLDQRVIARRLKVTQPAVQKALALDRQMRERGLDTPYVLVTEPPPDYPKLRRHLNHHYGFKPIEGYEPPPIQ